jgi:hypothetical protein
MDEVILFGDIEAGLIAHLTSEFADRGEAATVHSDLPDMPRPDRYVVVKRQGGPRIDLIRDGANVDFHCYADPRTEAHAIARLVRGIVGALRGQTISGMTVYRVQEYAGPAHMPHPKSSIPRYVFAARIEFRGVAEA